MTHESKSVRRDLFVPSGTLVILSGVQGAGKSSLAQRAVGMPPGAWVSSDALRTQILGAHRDLDEHGEFTTPFAHADNVVFSVLREIVRARLSKGLTTVVDTTAPTDAARQELAAIARSVGAAVRVLILNTPLEECLARNQARANRVPVDVLEATHATLQNDSALPFDLVDSATVLRFGSEDIGDARYDVIGDVHGLFDDLLSLLQAAGWEIRDGRPVHPQGRKLLFLGDLVDRGTQSVEVLRFVRNAVLAGVARVIKGNHEAKLVRFVDAAHSKQVGRWSSRANAETGMALMRLDAQERFFAGLNRYTVIRGHIPQTSIQPNVFSLERHPFQRGELVLLRLDEFLQARAQVGAVQAFERALVTRRCAFDFKDYSRKWVLDHELHALAGRKLIVQSTSPCGLLQTHKYSKRTFWDGLWNESPYLLKARGLVLDVAGNIVSHPFDKVFNYLENGTGQDLPPQSPVIAVEKLNGYLGVLSAHPVKRGQLLTHTQGAFEGEFVDMFDELLRASGRLGAITKFVGTNDVTLMFEVLHPNDPHIIEYGAQQHGVWLIGVRGKSEHALPWTETAVDRVATELGLRRPAWKRTTFGVLLDELGACRTEGWMVREDSAKQLPLLKLKSPYYLTTKFLGRLSGSRIKHMYGNPANFKQTVDEEFYGLVDALVARTPQDELLAMADVERVALVRGLVTAMFGQNA